MTKTKEEIREYQKQWRLENKDKKRSYMKEYMNGYREEKPEIFSRNRKKYKQNHRRALKRIENIHRWVKRNLGRPSKCENCGKVVADMRNIHWANKDHEYSKDLNDWMRLCRDCHLEYDSKVKRIRN